MIIGVPFTERVRAVPARTVVLVTYNHPNRELAKYLDSARHPASGRVHLAATSQGRTASFPPSTRPPPPLAPSDVHTARRPGRVRSAAVHALLCHQFGPPESLVVEEIEAPEPAPGQVLVDVRACSATFPDVLMIQGLYQVKPSFPFSPGGEVTGVVFAVGDGVSTVSVGDRVIAPLGYGGMAEQVRVPAAGVVPLPDGVGFEAAAGFLFAYGTSFHALRDRAVIQPGETLLVLGAAGGVGLATVELGLTMGATVIAAASSEAKLAVCRERGAAMTIDYEREDLKAAVRELTDGRGADVVYDPVGGRFSEPALRSTAWGGRFLVIGFASGEIPKLPLNLPLLKGSAVVGVFWAPSSSTNRNGPPPTDGNWSRCSATAGCSPACPRRSRWPRAARPSATSPTGRPKAGSSSPSTRDGRLMDERTRQALADDLTVDITTTGALTGQPRRPQDLDAPHRRPLLHHRDPRAS